MSLAQKIQERPYICGVLLSFQSDVSHLAASPDLQNFFDTEITNPDIQSIYTTKSKTSFQEVSQTSRSGYAYEQKVSLSFPIGSLDRSINIEQVKKTRHVILELTNGKYLFLGRTDVSTNTNIKVSYQSNEQTAVFTFLSKSMFPIGYTLVESLEGYPFIIY